MDDDDIVINADQIEELLESDNDLPPQGGDDVPNSFHGSDVDTANKGSIQEDREDVLGLEGIARVSEVTHNGNNESTNHQDCETPEGQVVGLPLPTGQTGPVCRDARRYLDANHTPAHELAADIINDIFALRTNWYPKSHTILDDNEWNVILSKTTPTRDDIERLRKELHTRRVNNGWQRSNPKGFAIDDEDVSKLLEYYHERSNDDENDRRITLAEWNTESELREKVLWRAQHYATINAYTNSRFLDGIPSLSKRTRAILDMDFYEARSTNRERKEITETTPAYDINRMYTAWLAAHQRLPESLQRACGPCRTYHGRCSGRVLSTGWEEDSEGTGGPVYIGRDEDDSDSNREPGEAITWEDLEQAKIPGDPCCSRCIQCKDIEYCSDNIPNGRHHVALVRIKVIPNAYMYDNEQVPYDTFDIRTCRERHSAGDICHKDKVVPYWRQPEFYSRLTDHARKRAATVWPFQDFETAGVKYKLQRLHVKYEPYIPEDSGIDDGSDEIVVVDDTRHRFSYSELKPPKHVSASDNINIGRYYPATYSGRFDVVFRVETEADKAREQRISCADDALAKRIKTILNDKKKYPNASDMHTLGAILLTIAAWSKEETKDQKDPKMPPYPKHELYDALGKTAMKDYKRTLENSRLQPCATATKTKTKAQVHASSTHGLRMDTRPTAAGPSGTPTISEKSHKDMSKEKKPTIDTSNSKSTKVTSLSTSTSKVQKSKQDTRSATIVKPPVKERQWDRKDKKWRPEPIKTTTTHTQKTRPRSRERERNRNPYGGRDYSGSPRRPYQTNTDRSPARTRITRKAGFLDGLNKNEKDLRKKLLEIEGLKNYVKI